MRKIKLQLQTTADGYLSGPNGELDWVAASWTDDISAHVEALWEPVDCIVLGRKLAEGFIPAWESGPEGETQEGIDKMNNTPKLVLSHSLTESPWKNATVTGGDLAEIVGKLKAQPGGDVMVAGGGSVARELIAKELLDEIHLFVNPVAIGEGVPVFPAQRFRLADATPFECGVIAMHWQPARS
ncbi:dihydrofolate reductase family protein [Actinomadura hibisca]|uniref:dihydrofolate reductase family protein n=1 Tax=Actinomadura hibisca TaxID=68565 RepID=UPI000833C935|nr:dihydrofolate reductase family protein [Actinomadura hibisca]